MLKEDIMSSYLIFDLKDGRKVAGTLESVDFKGNCVLKDVIVELPLKNVSPVNEHLIYNFDNTKELNLRLKHFYSETEDKNLNALEKNCFCVNGLILPRAAVERVRRVIKS